MSRSHKKRPFVAVTTSKSDKPFKRESSRVYRRLVRQILVDNPFVEVLPEKREVSDIYDSPKEGVCWAADYEFIKFKMMK